MIVKRFLKTYEVLHPALEHCVNVEQACECMRINGTDYKEFQRCFACRKQFKNDEIPYSSYVLGSGARFFCSECAEIINEECSIPVKSAASIVEPSEPVSISLIPVTEN